MQPQSTPVDRVAYSPSEFAALWGTSRQHVHKLIRSGALSSVLIGRCRRIPASELARLLGQAGEA